MSLVSMAKVTVVKTQEKPTKTVQKLKKAVDPEVTVSDDLNVYYKDVEENLPEISRRLNQEIFKNRPKISVGELKKILTDLDDHNEDFWISLQDWTGGMQTELPQQEQVAVQLNITPDMIKRIKASPVVTDFLHDYFSTIGADPNHPTHSQTIAWARVYKFPDKYIIEEIQSDLFGAKTKEAPNKATQELYDTYSKEEQKEIKDFWTKHMHDWDKKLMSSVMSMARRDGVKDIWMFDEHTKANPQEYGGDNGGLKSQSMLKRYYRDLPKDLGFKRADIQVGDREYKAWHRVVAKFMDRVVGCYRIARA